jgi:carbonic anhydrase
MPVGVARVPVIALVAHTDCGMAHVTVKREIIVQRLVDWGGCKEEDTSSHFAKHATN